MYLVCDGGGTKTDFLLFDARGTVLACWRGAGTNALFCPVEAAAAVVCEGVRRCLQSAGAKPEELRRAALFIPGFRAALPLVEAELGVRGIDLQGDAESAFYGALGGTAGIVVLSGTGSFCLGRDRAGTAARAGGWGPLFGDEGSGYHIGLLCLGEITRQYDAGAADSPLTALALRQLDVPDVPSLRSAQGDAARFGRAGIASLTRWGRRRCRATRLPAGCWTRRRRRSCAWRPRWRRASLRTACRSRSRAGWRRWASRSWGASGARLPGRCPAARTGRRGMRRSSARRCACCTTWRGWTSPIPPCSND